MKIAGRTLKEWIEFSRRDDCLANMVPSDLREVLGHVKEPVEEADYYVLEPRKLRTGGIATAAIRRCGLCGGMISGMGGPGHGSVCKPCGEALKKQQLIGAVVWDDTDSSREH